jgi:DNA ligase (NAD+)
MSKEYFQIPKTCPVCGQQTKVSGKFLICANEECEGSAIGSIKKWVDKSEMKTLGIGDKTIENLFNAGLIKTPADLYRLKKEDILKLERQGERSSQKLIDIIQSKRELSLPAFIGALNIKDFSTSMTERLVEAGYDTIEKLQKLAEIPDASLEYCLPFELITIDGIGEKKADAFIRGINKKRELIEDLLTVVSIIKKEKKGESNKMVSGKLSGQSFCFTGAINRIDPDTGKHMTREKMWELVKANGGTVETSLKKGTGFLVQSDPNSVSGKTQKAKKLRVIIISEDDFFKMISF